MSRVSKLADGKLVYEGASYSVLDGLDVPEGTITRVTVSPDGTKTVYYDCWGTEYSSYTVRPDGTEFGVPND